jgi:rRNA maturation endonuclease Nob1
MKVTKWYALSLARDGGSEVVLILSEAFIDSSWCNFEAEYTLSLKLDMKESKTIIPLYTDVYSLTNAAIKLDCIVLANVLEVSE